MIMDLNFPFAQKVIEAEAARQAEGRAKKNMIESLALKLKFDDRAREKDLINKIAVENMITKRQMDQQEYARETALLVEGEKTERERVKAEVKPVKEGEKPEVTEFGETVRLEELFEQHKLTSDQRKELKELEGIISDAQRWMSASKGLQKTMEKSGEPFPYFVRADKDLPKDASQDERLVLYLSNAGFDPFRYDELRLEEGKEEVAQDSLAAIRASTAGKPTTETIGRAVGVSQQIEQFTLKDLGLESIMTIPKQEEETDLEALLKEIKAELAD